MLASYSVSQILLFQACGTISYHENPSCGETVTNCSLPWIIEVVNQPSDANNTEVKCCTHFLLTSQTIEDSYTFSYFFWFYDLLSSCYFEERKYLIINYFLNFIV